jgi:hypothetical protein
VKLPAQAGLGASVLQLTDGALTVDLDAVSYQGAPLPSTPPPASGTLRLNWTVAADEIDLPALRSTGVSAVIQGSKAVLSLSLGHFSLGADGALEIDELSTSMQTSTGHLRIPKKPRS